MTVIPLILVAALGLLLGRLKILGVQVGVVGVLFAGIVAGHIGLDLDPATLEFVRDFGLLLFVYAIGVQVGPGFMAALRQRGVRLILLAAGVVFCGAAIAWALARTGITPPFVTLGLYCGAVTNTPALGAAQGLLKTWPGFDPAALAQPGIGYALAYPFGVIGTIGAMVLLRVLGRLSVVDEAERFAREQSAKQQPLLRRNIEVTNANFEGRSVTDIPGLAGSGVVISRRWHEGELTLVTPHSHLHVGDILLAVGPAAGLNALQTIIGKESARDLMALPGAIEVQRAIVTDPRAVGETLLTLQLTHRYGVVVTRVIRGEVELSAAPGLRLNAGDVLLLVGPPQAISRAMNELGNRVKDLEQVALLPILAGMTLGAALGQIPIPVPGLQVPLKLGIAAGGLLAAMALACLGRIGQVLWHLPHVANHTLRDLGITLFLACVGIKAGHGFVDALVGGGWVWMMWAGLVTLVPIVPALFVARRWLKMDYLSCCGFLSGAMTDPPALAYAQSMAASNAPALAYASVYPLVMLLRILSAQVLALLLLS